MPNEALHVLWEDESLIFVDKPAGVSSQSPGMPESIADYLGGGSVYVLHRLDREVSGVMVYAKTKAAAAAVSAQIAAGELTKEYLAWVTGHPVPAGELRDLLYHDRGRNKTYVVSRPRKGVKEAILTYTAEETRGDCTLVRVHLVTGRTHQIRVQFASRGFPLVGDAKYGGPKGKIALRSCLVSLTHPTTGERITVEAPVEDIFSAGIDFSTL